MKRILVIISTMSFCAKHRFTMVEDWVGGLDVLKSVPKEITNCFFGVKSIMNNHITSADNLDTPLV